MLVLIFALLARGGAALVAPMQVEAAVQEIEISGSAPSGQNHGTDVVKNYEYGSDGRGYLTQARSYIWDTGAVSRRPLSVEFHSWITEKLFDDRISVVREAFTDSRTCLSSDEQVCIGDDRTAFASALSSTSVNAVQVNGKRVLFVPDVASHSTSDHAGEQQLTHTTYDVLYAATGDGFDYRTLPKETKTEHQVGLGPSAVVTTTSKEVTEYDPNHFPIRTKSWFGPGTNDFITSERTFETATGLVKTTKRPEQTRLGSAGKVASYTYDDNKVFAEVVINELGYGKHTYHDPGTGVVIRETGPNMAFVSNDPNCADLLCRNVLQTQESVWSVDGFGRELSFATTYQLGETVTAAPLVVLTTTTYDDANNIVISRSLKDPLDAAQRWVTTKKTSDGTGRALANTTCPTAGSSGTDSACISSPTNATVSYLYDAAGLMISMTMPDPSSDSSSVTYTFAHDSVGRPTVMTRPDGSAIKMEYGALDTKTSESGTVAQGGSTVASRDMDSNVVEVRECLVAPCDAWPSVPYDHNWTNTVYSYDDFNRITQIDDAQGNTTALEHDFLGRRTKITRGTRIWKYSYDHDGNMTAEISPLPAGETDEAKYTSSSTYDELDRIAQHTPASRGATAAQLRSQWIVPFKYSYDDAANGVGLVSSITQQAVGLPNHTFYFSTAYSYDGMGHVKQESRLMNPSGVDGAGVAQSVTISYNALGAVKQSAWDDGEVISNTYDDRGLPQTVACLAAGARGAPTVVADYGTRNRAGLPLKRKALGGMIERNWTYDTSGRVLTDQVQRVSQSSGQVVLAQRTYAYLPNGELQSLVGKTRKLGQDSLAGFQSLNLTYGYDATHRVTTAHEATSGYDLVLTYDRIGNILSSKLAGVPHNSGPDPNRDVLYHYDWLDPQAVDGLVDRRSNAQVASMTYSAAGEMTSRSWPIGSSMDMTWDGDGQLREAHNPDGTIERYGYDPSGQRIWAVKENAADAGSRYWFGSSETFVPASSAASASRRIYISDGGGALARTDRVGTGIASLEVSFADALQNQMLSAKAGRAQDGGQEPVAVITSWFHYGAFGEVLAQGGEADHRRQFNGKESDAGTGLRYYGARYYDPLLMRWNSADPLFRFAPEVNLLSPQQQNLYSFTGNNPVRLIDPDGRAAGLIIVGVACPECVAVAAIGVGVMAATIAIVGVGQMDEPADDAAPLLGGPADSLAFDGAGNAGSWVQPWPDSKVLNLPDTGSVSHAEARGSRVQAKPLEGKPKPRVVAAGGGPSGGKKEPKKVYVNSKKHPQSVKHLKDAKAMNKPLTVDRAGKAGRRKDNLAGRAKVPGKDLDEAPPAMFKEGKNASVRPIDPSDNRGCGSSIGNQCRDVPNGGQVILVDQAGSK